MDLPKSEVDEKPADTEAAWKSTDCTVQSGVNIVLYSTVYCGLLYSVYYIMYSTVQYRGLKHL